MDELFLLYLLRKKHKNYKSKRRFWMHSIFKYREQLGEFHSLVKELSSHEDKFFQYFRMSQAQFNKLLELVAPDIMKKDTTYRKSISAQERLAICLR